MSADEHLGHLSDMRDRASYFVSKRRSDLELYQLLAEMLATCRKIDAAGTLSEIKAKVIERQSNDARNRSYFQSTSDVYLVVGRYVFEGEKRRDAAWRYTAVLREVAKRNIPPDDLPSWFAENGGMNALFRARPVKSRTAKTKTLHLNSQIEVPKTGTISLRLKRDHRGFFDVLQEAAL